MVMCLVRQRSRFRAERWRFVLDSAWIQLSQAGRNVPLDETFTSKLEAELDLHYLPATQVLA